MRQLHTLAAMTAIKDDQTVFIVDDVSTADLFKQLLRGLKRDCISDGKHCYDAVTVVDFMHTLGSSKLWAVHILQVAQQIVGAIYFIDTRTYLFVRSVISIKSLDLNISCLIGSLEYAFLALVRGSYDWIASNRRTRIGRTKNRRRRRNFNKKMKDWTIYRRQ